MSIKHTLILILLGSTLGIAPVLYYKIPNSYTTAKKAVTVIYPTQEGTAQGIVTFEQKKDGVHLYGTITGLNPGKHGFHIHTFGNCSCPDAVCAGGHFNPTNKQHGAPTSSERHVGDLGNIHADENGIATIDMHDAVINLNGPYTIIGRSLIIHDHEDDFTSQPTGKAGKRIGCGVIGFAE